MNTTQDKLSSIVQARSLIVQCPVFLDTETTGLEGEVCEIAIVGSNGNVLVNTLVRPRGLMQAAAQAVHGISDEMLAAAPSFAEVWPAVCDIITHRQVVIYNARFDVARLTTSALAAGHNSAITHLRQLFQRAACAMELYAQFYGEWNYREADYKWQRLGNAAAQCGLTPPAHLHRAAADAELTRRLVHHMAAQPDYA